MSGRRVPLALLCVLVCTAVVMAQPDDSTGYRADTTILSSTFSDSLLSVLVIGRRGEDRNRILQATEVITAADITAAQSLTTTDAMADLGGVYVQKSQFGGGSPVLRGFEANRVLLVVDGVRMNNAIYRGGHLQNAISVDPLALQRIEVLYGAGSLAYGSDALGGVVHFRTREPQFLARPRDARLTGGVAVNGATAARSLQAGASINYAATDWASLTVVSTTQTGHLRAGAKGPPGYPDFGRRFHYVERRNGRDRIVTNERPLRQVGTAFKQYNVLQKVRYKFSDRLALSANLQVSTTGDVPRYDNLTQRRNGQPRWARWDYGPQTRTLASVALSDRTPRRLYDVANYLLSHQLVRESRHTRRFNAPVQTSNVETVNVYNVQIDYSKALGNGMMRYGFDARGEGVNSEAFGTELAPTDGASVLVPTRYPGGGSSLYGAGVYVDAERNLSDRWVVRGGLRYSLQTLIATFDEDGPIEWPRAYTGGLRNRTAAVTGSIGLRRTGKNGRLRILANRGFRTPNIDDFAKTRERSGFLHIPNPNLKPEYTATAEFGYERTLAGGKLALGVTAYHTWLTNAVTRMPGTLPDGNSNVVLFTDTLPVQTNGNASDATIYGADFTFRYHPTNSLTCSVNLSALRGRRKAIAPDGQTLSLPQDHIPPPFGTLSVAHQKGPLQVTARLQGQLAKPLRDYSVSNITSTPQGVILDRTGTSDNLELTPVDANDNFVGARAWWTFDVQATYRLSDRWRLRLKADNVFDHHYRTFASGISAPGADVGAGVTYRW